MNFIKQKWQSLPDNWKRYIKSSFVTFVSVFGLLFLTQLETLSVDSLGIEVLLSIGLTALRGALKAVFEYLLTLKNQGKAK